MPPTKKRPSAEVGKKSAQKRIVISNKKEDSGHLHTKLQIGINILHFGLVKLLVQSI